MLQLYIGNKNYSSWSLRPWLALRQLGIAFEEMPVRFDSFAPDSHFKQTLLGLAPTGKVPLLVDNGLEIEGKANYGFYWSIWWFFFWTCNQDLSPPWHPLLKSWENTWALLLASPQGEKVKRVLDDHMPKSQAIIARKPSN